MLMMGLHPPKLVAPFHERPSLSARPRPLFGPALTQPSGGANGRIP